MTKHSMIEIEGDALTESTVNSTVCGFVHKILGNKNGNKIIVDIDTPCVISASKTTQTKIFRKKILLERFSSDQVT